MTISDPQENIRQRPHVPHKLHISKLGSRDVSVGGRPPHQPLAPRDHRPELQHRGHQAR